MSYFTQQDHDSEPILKPNYFQCDWCCEIEEKRYMNEHNGKELHSECMEEVKEKEHEERVRWWAFNHKPYDVRGNFNFDLYEAIKEAKNGVRN